MLEQAAGRLGEDSSLGKQWSAPPPSRVAVQPGTAKRGRTRMASLGLCSAILAMLVGGCGASARDATAEAKPSVALYSEGAAAAVAGALLAAVPLPADTQRVSEPPQAVAGKLGRPANSLVGATARWLMVTITTPAYRALNPGEPSHAHTTTRSVITTAPATVRAVARAVDELPLAEPAGAAPQCPEEGFANTVDAPSFRLTFRTSASAGNLARVIGVSGYVCERGGEDTAKITTPEDPQGLQLTNHLNTIGPSEGEGLTEHIELAFRHSLHLVPED